MFPGVFIIFLLLVILLVYGIISYSTNYVVQNLNDDIQSNADLNNVSKTEVQKLATGFPTWNDNVFAMIFLLFWLFGMVSAFMLDTNPFFIVVFLILIFVAFFLVGTLSNFWGELGGDAMFSTYSANMPITNFILNNYVLVFVVIFVSTAIVAYIKGGGFN